jgi:hypothetical protein
MVKIKFWNRRADITVTILVIGIFAICTLATISFLISKIHVRSSFTGVDLMEKMNSQIESYSISHDLSKVDTKVNDQGVRVFYQDQKDSSGYLWWKSEKVIFSVEYKVPQ